MDKNYFDKSGDFIASANKHWAFEKKILGLGFQPPKMEGWQLAGDKLDKFYSHRTDWPKNRDFYVCAEGGEFLKYFQFAEDDIIVHTDSDMIIQRPMSTYEESAIRNLVKGEVGGSYNSPYPVTLREEFWRLRGTGYPSVRARHYPEEWIFPTFCAGVIVARADTYVEIYKHYIGNLAQMMTAFDHHAAGQFHLNYYVHNRMKFVDLGFQFHNGFWFLDTEAVVEDNMLMYKNQKVLFNHTKYDGDWKY